MEPPPIPEFGDYNDVEDLESAINELYDAIEYALVVSALREENQIPIFGEGVASGIMSHINNPALFVTTVEYRNQKFHNISAHRGEIILSEKQAEAQAIDLTFDKWRKSIGQDQGKLKNFVSELTHYAQMYDARLAEEADEGLIAELVRRVSDQNWQEAAASGFRTHVSAAGSPIIRRVANIISATHEAAAAYEKALLTLRDNTYRLLTGLIVALYQAPHDADQVEFSIEKLGVFVGTALASGGTLGGVVKAVADTSSLIETSSQSFKLSGSDVAGLISEVTRQRDQEIESTEAIFEEIHTNLEAKIDLVDELPRTDLSFPESGEIL